MPNIMAVIVAPGADVLLKRKGATLIDQGRTPNKTPIIKLDGEMDGLDFDQLQR